ncbi:MAG: phosphoribosylamine--glycine ligase [Helicobacteraceae bacterium]|jgi:phosphoribosylamine--glycine ligase|nr:phosphoribosylamine--glycine ligase [Helicobacteraceae bacterium]
MRVLIIGNGAREYSLGLAFKRDKSCSKIYFARGNGATETIGENIAIVDCDALANFAVDNNIDLTIVGNEAPLVEGIVDIFRAKSLVIFGPDQAAARLEGSKAFTKNFLTRHNIPTANFIESGSFDEIAHFIDTRSTAPIVVKADGLCAGKGVIIAESKEEAKDAARLMLSGKSFASAGDRVVIEEFLDGFELSVFAISDGVDFIVLPACQDHKRLLTGDLGPNTGGMGAYAPTPLATDDLIDKIKTRIIKPTIDGMREEGTPFTGALFCGIMVSQGEPFVLEFNVRFGDPECEALMALLETPATELFYAAATCDLNAIKPVFKNRSAVGVVVASREYPIGAGKPKPITIESGAENENAHISYGGVTKGANGELLASGGRALVCVGLGDDVKTARDNAYDLVKKTHFDGMRYRTDIAYQVLR